MDNCQEIIKLKEEIDKLKNELQRCNFERVEEMDMVDELIYILKGIGRRDLCNVVDTVDINGKRYHEY
jgi:hypothetical protein